jgi:two-component system cell cycle response regulator CpdR
MARILLAEDDDALRRFLGAALAKAGHDVVSVADGEGGLAAMDAASFDLLLADAIMPGIDGLDLARRAILEHPDMRVMFITGFAAVALAGARIPQARRGPSSKPFHLRDLVGQIDRLLAA